MNIKPIEIESYEKAKDRASIQLSIFLAGPAIDVKIAHNKISKKANDYRGKRARKLLFERLDEYLGQSPILGEHKQLIVAGEKHFQDLANLTITEMSFIRGFHGVIILPSSVGSFCEFGLFSAYEDICKKMLVIIDKKHEKPEGYLHLGPAKLAESFNSQITFVDYMDDYALWAVCESYLELLKSRVLRSRALGQSEK